MPDESPRLFRVTAGNPDPVELAALTAVLVTLCRNRRPGNAAQDRTAPAATWRRRERVPGFADPRAWSTGDLTRRAGAARSAL